MEEYWPRRLTPAQTTGAAPGRHSHAPATADARASSPGTQSEHSSSQSDSDDDFDRARAQRLRADPSGGWKSELQRYLDDPASEVKKTTDTLQWWAVSTPLLPRCLIHELI